MCRGYVVLPYWASQERILNMDDDHDTLAAVLCDVLLEGLFSIFEDTAPVKGE